jgi:cellulase/cellobiase CelA1
MWYEHLSHARYLGRAARKTRLKPHNPYSMSSEPTQWSEWWEGYCDREDVTWTDFANHLWTVFIRSVTRS